MGLDGESVQNSTTSSVNVEMLARLLKEKRERAGLSIRQAAAEANVSFSTFGRVERGNQPDLTTFVALCAWLGVPPRDFFTPIAERQRDTVEKVAEHLSADERLPREASEKIVALVRDMYDALSRQADTERENFLAMHLRAASVMRPGVPQRLTALLFDMKDALQERVDSPS